MAEIAARKAAPGKPFAKNDPRINRTIPGSGRPPSVFKDFLKRLRQDPAFQDALELAASDPTSRGYSAALKVVTDYDDDKPAEKKEMSGKFEVSVRFTHE